MDNVQNYKLPMNDQLVFQKICQFLNITEVMQLMCVCKTYQQLSNQYFKWLLRNIGLLKEEEIINLEKELFDQQQPIKYNIMYKYFHNREVLYTSLEHPIQRDNYQQMKVYRCRNQIFLKNKCVKDFTIGTKWCAFLTHEDDLYICKSVDFYESPKLEFLIRKNVRKFFTRPQNLFYLTKAGTVCVLFYNEQQACKDMQEAVINWTLNLPVEDMTASYLFAVFILRENNDQVEISKNTALLQKFLIGKQIQKDEPEQIQLQLELKLQQQQKQLDEENKENQPKRNIVIGFIKDLFADQLDDHNKYKRIASYPYYQVEQFCVGFHNAYFTSPENQVLDVDLSTFTNVDVLMPGQLRISEMKCFNGKKIVKLFSGLSYYFALQREETLSIENWNNDEVLKFVDKIGMVDYKGIFKYAEITGKILQTITKKYMKDTLGITKEDLQNKLLTEIGKYQKTVYDPYILWGWGKNETGQLGLVPCPNVNFPIQIPLPTLDYNDNIKIVECGWKNSFILTEKNQIWVTDQTAKQKIEKQSQQENEEVKENTQDDKKKSQKKNKQQKQRQQQQQQKSTSKEADDEENNNRWINITPQFTQLKDKRKYKIYDISQGKDTFSALGVCFDNKILSNLRKQSNDEDENQKKKLTPIDKVLNRITWDEHLDKSEFSIVYEDRFLGDIEIKFDEFKNTEIKIHRIKIFKKNGEIVWDRERKIDLL